jgi:hypothetical protein
VAINGAGLKSDISEILAVLVAMSNNCIFLRVRIPNLVCAFISNDFAIAPAAVLPCQIQTAAPVRRYATPTSKQEHDVVSHTSAQLRDNKKTCTSALAKSIMHVCSFVVG